MSLLAGTRLGAYEIVAPLGAGGMGEVYRARDVRLGRDVAIKVLPELFAADPDRLMRFDREARTLASLNHPHIAQIHGLEESAGVRALVMELVEGATVEELLAAGPPPLADAMSIASQVADALAAAHDAGIVHRDLKPANIKVRPDGTVKVLDFGLAKALAPDAASAGPSVAHSPTFTSPAMTQMGVVIGTAAYMAPEQARGKPVDRRVDLWAFGCVLYELLSGRAAFAGDTVTDILSAVISRDPDWNALPATTPPGVRRLLVRCLERDTRRRLGDAAEARYQLEESLPAAGGSTVAPAAIQVRRRSGTAILPWGLVLLSLIASIAAWTWRGRHNTPPVAQSAITMRAVLPVEPVERYGGSSNYLRIALSPDGRKLALVTNEKAKSVLRLRDLATGESRVLTESEEIGEPFFSPDGQFVAFSSNFGGANRPESAGMGGLLRKVAVSGGAPTTLLPAINSFKGGSWGDDGWIYYSPAPASSLWRVRADGSAPEMLTTLDTSRGEKSHRRPYVLPGSKAVLFVVGTSRIESFDDARIEVLSLADHERHVVAEGGTAPIYLPTGHVVYARAGKLIAVPFDAERLQVLGPPVTVLDGVVTIPQNGVSPFSVSSNGSLVYVAGSAQLPPAPLLVVDRKGTRSKLVDAPGGRFTSGRLSPDGQRLVLDPDAATQQLVVVDLKTGRTERLTFEWDNATPVWTADGSHLIIRSNRHGGTRNLYSLAADGSDHAEHLAGADAEQVPGSVYGNSLAYEQVDASAQTDIHVLALDTKTRRPLLATPAQETSPRFSPDGTLIAYQSDQSGEWEVYVQTFPEGGRRWQVSQGGGVQPVWQRQGLELNYRQRSEMMSVSLTRTPELHVGAPVRLFPLEPHEQLVDVMPDGRFIVAQRSDLGTVTTLSLIVNWFEEINARVPSGRR